jgi:hypothetical protein
MKEAPDFSETSVLTRATRRNNPEDTILHSHRRENLKSYDVRMDLVEIEWAGVDWIGLVHDRALVNAVMNLRVP